MAGSDERATGNDEQAADIDERLVELDAVADDAIPAKRYPEDAYRDALEAMARVSDEHYVAELAGRIEDLMRQSGRAPREPAARSEGRDLCDRNGFEIPADS